MNTVGRSRTTTRNARRPALTTPVTLGGVGVLVVALAGCSSVLPTGHPTGASAAAAPGSPSSPDPASPTQVTRPAVVTSTAPPSVATPTPQHPGTPTPRHPGWLTASIAVTGPSAVLTPGGPAVPFTVTVANGSAESYSDLLPLVSLGHCDYPWPNVFFPTAGTLQKRDSATGAWEAIDYDTEGTGMDFVYDTGKQSGIPALRPGGTATFDYRLALAPAGGHLTRRRCAIDVSLVKLPVSLTEQTQDFVIGRAPADSTPVDVLSVLS